MARRARLIAAALGRAAMGAALGAALPPAGQAQPAPPPPASGQEAAVATLIDQANYWRLQNRPELALRTLERVLAVDPRNVDALAGAGFDKGAMQVTPDESTIGNAAESIEFSVRLGADCLVGQVGPSIGNPVTTVLPGLSSGGCLIGQTRPIDW